MVINRMQFKENKGLVLNIMWKKYKLQLSDTRYVAVVKE